MIQNLTKLGVHLNEERDNRDEKGFTPLLLSCITSSVTNNEKMDTVQFLREHGADIKYSAGSELSTPLFAACMHGEMNIVKYLIENKADPDNKVNNKQLHCLTLFQNLWQQEVQKFYIYTLLAI